MFVVASEARACSIANALQVIGERWSLLALREIFFGVRRFDQIVRNTGASRDILAARLHTLVEAGVLEKQLYERRPPRYEYVLTESGQALHTILLTLMDWGDRYITAGPPPTIWRHGCGAILVPKTVCAACGEPVRTQDMTLVKADGFPAPPAGSARPFNGPGR
jgi:DNA-binding HxlR family transcriptional regulator